MLSHLVSLLPSPPASVLDVGCGLGLSAAELSRTGHTVTALSPFPELIEYAHQTYGSDGPRFTVKGFFDEDDDVFSAAQYDVVLFRESVQHLGPLASVIAKTRLILKDGGMLIISGEVCHDSSIKHLTTPYSGADFMIALSEGGYRILEHEQIGDSVSPMCDFYIKAFTAHSDEIVRSLKAEDISERLPLVLDGWKNRKEWYARGQISYEIFVARKDNFFIRPYSPGDEDAIVPMFREIFQTERSQDHWNWKYRDNPYGSLKISVACSDKHGLVAHYAGYPVPFYAPRDLGGDFVSYQIGDTMTHPVVRNIGLGKTGLLARTANHFYARFCKGKIPFIYGFNTGKIKKLGTRYLGYGYIDPVTLWVNDSVQTLAEKPPLLTRLFGGYTVDEVDDVTPEWDSFFKRVSADYVVLVRRDAEYLRWRYLTCPDNIHRVFSIRKRGRLVGWSAFREEDNRIIWGDAFFDRNCPRAVALLLQHLFKKDFSGCTRIEGWFSKNPDWWLLQLKQLGFTPHEEPNNLTPAHVIFPNSPIRKETLQHHFYFTIGDSDLF